MKKSSIRKTWNVISSILVALVVLLALLLPLLLAVPALALDSYELFARWEQDGYPEDVTGVF